MRPHFVSSLTAQIHKVVVLQAVDSLDLAANVEVAGRLEEVGDGRVLLVTSKDLLSLEVPGTCVISNAI
jgi:hypothetical protein